MVKLNNTSVGVTCIVLGVAVSTIGVLTMVDIKKLFTKMVLPPSDSVNESNKK